MRPVIAVDARYGLRSPRRGVGEYVYQVMKALKDRDRPYDLVLYGDASHDAATVAEMRQWYEVRIVKAPNFFLWEQSAFPRASAAADLVHGTANIAPLWGSVPQILTIHDVIEWHRGRDFPSKIPMRHHLSRFYRMNALKRLAPRAREILTVSHHAKADILEVLGVDPDRIQVSPLAGKYPIRQEPRTQTGGEPRYLLTLGALDPRKNLVAVLRGFAAVKGHDLVLRVVGVEERGRAALAALVKSYGLESRVQVESMVSDTVLQGLYRDALAFIYLSRYEGFGLPLLEAMSQGCPVIYANESSLPEVAGPAGVACSPHDKGAIAAEILRLADDPDYRWDQQWAGLRRARDFSWDLTAVKTHEGYMRALGAKVGER